MAVAATSLTSGTSATDGTSFATASVTPSGNRLVLLGVWSARNDSVNAEAPSSVTGNGLTWVQVATIAFDAAGAVRETLTLFRALGASPSTGAVTINFSSTHHSCSWSLVEFSGVDTGGTNGSAALVQAVTASSAVDADGVLSVTLAAFGDAANATYGFFGANSGTATVTPGSGFTELHEVAQAVSPLGTIQTEWRADNDTSVDATYSVTSLDMGGIAVEIKAAAAGLSAALGTATETDTALPLGRAKRKPLGIATETDSALTVGVLLAPVNTVAPVIVGTPMQGSTLSCSQGTWINAPTSFSYQWQRSSAVGVGYGEGPYGEGPYGGTEWTDIPGALANEYLLTDVDVGFYIRCVVTASNAGGATAAASNVLGPVVAKPNLTALPPRLFIETEWDLDPTATVGTEHWRRITHLLRSFSTRRGGTGRALERIEAGSSSGRFDNTDRRFESGYQGTLTNYVDNPSVEGAATGYTHLGSADVGHIPASGGNAASGNAYWMIARTGGAVQNGDGVRIIGTDGNRIPVTPGPWGVSAHIWNIDAGPLDFRIDIKQHDSGGGLLSTTTVDSGTLAAPPNAWTRRGGPVTIGAATVTVAIEIVVTSTGSGPNPQGLAVDAVQLEPGSAMTDYIDGDSDNGRWEGTPHLSRSFRGGPYDPNVRPMRRIRYIAVHGNPVEDSGLETLPHTVPDDPALHDAWNRLSGNVTRVTTTPHAGSYCYRGEDDGTGNHAQVTTASRYRIPVEAGDVLLLSIHFRKPVGGAHPHSTAYLTVYDRASVPIAQGNVGDINPPETEWQRYSTSPVTVPAGGNYADVTVQIVDSSCAAATVAYADDIQIDYDALTPYEQGQGPRVLHRGFIQRLPQYSPGRRRGEVVLNTVDGMAILGAAEYAGSPPSEGSNARINRLLDDLSWPALLRILDAGTATLAAITDLKTKHLTHAQAVAETERGQFFVNGPGYAVLHDKDHRDSAPRSTISQATFGDKVDGRVNLVLNPSFEVDLANWGVFGNADARSRDTAVGKHGAASCKITRTATAGVLGAASDSVAVTAGQVVTGSVWLRLGTAPASQVQVSLEETAGGASAYGAAIIDSDGDWRRYAVTVTVAAGVTAMRLIVYHTGTTPADDGETFWLDAAQIEAAAAAATEFLVGGPELPFLPAILPDQDVQDVINEVKATSGAASPVEQVATIDATSRDQYWPRSKSYTTLHSTDAAALTWAQAVRDKFKQPPLDIERLDIEPARDPRLWPVALNLEIGDLITINRRPQGLELRTFDAFIEAIEHHCVIEEDRVRWQTSLTLSAAA